VRTYHEGPKPTLKTGTFYLAGNRNFLLGSDIYLSVHSPSGLIGGAGRSSLVLELKEQMKAVSAFY
jgi:hypothetical protein